MVNRRSDTDVSSFVTTAFVHVCVEKRWLF